MTNKVDSAETEEVLLQDYRTIAEGLEEMTKLLGSNYQDFRGGYIEGKNLRQTFFDPRPDQMTNWFFYSAHHIQKENEDKNYFQEKTKTRVYLHPKVEYWFKVYPNILQELVALPEIQENGMQSKTPNFFKFSRLDFAAMKNQHDRIIFYFGDRANERALQIIAKYVAKHPEYFEDCHSLAAPVPDKIGKNLLGIFVSDEMTQLNNTSFNNTHAEIIEEILQKLAKKYTKPDGQNPTLQEVWKKVAQGHISKKELTEYLVVQYNKKIQLAGLNPDNIAFLQSSE